MKQAQQAQVYSFSSGRLAVQGRAADRRPSVFRRIVAGVIDRLIPLPFLAFFFHEWTLVVLAYHLLCECSPERRSVGKRTPAALGEAKNKLGPNLARLRESASQQIKDKAARLGSLVKRDRKGGSE